MQNIITKVFDSEDDLRRWHEKFTNSDDDPETWIGPQSILHGFELTKDSGLYCEGEDVSEIPHTTDFDCGYFSSAGVWNDSIENLLNEFRDGGRIQIDIWFDEPLVNPDDWDWRYENPSPYVLGLMEDYHNRKKEQENNVVTQYEGYVDAFLRADDEEYHVDVFVAKQAKKFLATLSSENEEAFLRLLWSDVIAAELSEDRQVEIEESYLRAKSEFEKLLFKEPFDYLHSLKTPEEPLRDLGTPE
ncbi:MAG: hypothetical protein NTY15_10215 [Planctomycetota bacterium]|nr:hypothetical protein [Planctomycetota bacterium]